MKEKILNLLEKIEWIGPVDFSIGVSTCPCCRRRKDIPGWKGQGHSEGCELALLIKELSKPSWWCCSAEYGKHEPSCINYEGNKE